jgi:serine/threonine-protein kinase
MDAAEVEIRTLGTLAVRDAAGRELAALLAQPKLVALLVYLAVAGRRGPLQRDGLVAVFWPELDEPHARSALSQALYRLKASLWEGVAVSMGKGDVRLGAGCWCDAAAFRDLLERGDAATAMSLYHGDFLLGFHLSGGAAFGEWLERERGEIERLAHGAAATLAQTAEAVGDLGEAVRWLNRAIEISPTDEVALRRAVEVQDRLGDRAGAVAIYDEFAGRLRRDYGLEPSPETVALVERVRTRTQRREPEAEPVEEPSPAEDQSPAVHGVRRGSDRHPLRYGALALALVGAAVTAYAAMRTLGLGAAGPPAPATALERRDRLIVAPFENRTADPLLGHTVSVALALDLEQSAAIRLVPAAEIESALRRMAVDPATPFDAALAREVAVREGVKGVVMGEINPAGVGYVLTARMVSGESGETLFAVRETARDSSEIVQAIDGLSSSVRRRIGESLRGIRASPPLSQVTTASLPALRRYSQAVRLEAAGDPARAILLLEEAIELDTAFAMAHRRLGTLLLTTRFESARVAQALSRAFAHRDRLTERERLLAEGSYHRFVSRDQERARAVYQRLLDLDPADPTVLGDLASVYAGLGDYGRAEELNLRAYEADSNYASALFDAVAAQLMQGRLEDAARTADRAAARFPADPRSVVRRLWIAYRRPDEAPARALADSLAAHASGRGLRVLGGYGQWLLAERGGRWRDAEAYYRRTMELLARPPAQAPEYIVAAAVRARFHLIARRASPDGLREVAAALRRFPLDALPVAVRPYAVVAHIYALAGDLPRARELMARYDALVEAGAAPSGPYGDAAYPPLWNEGLRLRALGTIAEREGRLDHAIREYALAEAKCGICALAHLAGAFDRTGQPDSAIAAGERFLASWFPERVITDAADLPGILLRLGELYEARGDGARAAARYGRLAELWRNADPELHPVLRDLERRLARVDARP